MFFSLLSFCFSLLCLPVHVMSFSVACLSVFLSLFPCLPVHLMSFSLLSFSLSSSSLSACPPYVLLSSLSIFLSSVRLISCLLLFLSDPVLVCLSVCLSPASLSAPYFLRLITNADIMPNAVRFWRKVLQ